MALDRAHHIDCHRGGSCWCRESDHWRQLAEGYSKRLELADADRDALRARVAELEAEKKRMRDSRDSALREVDDAQKCAATLQAEVERLQAPHQPRAAPSGALTRDDLRRWRERVRHALPASLEVHFDALVHDHDLWHLEAQLASAALHDTQQALAESERKRAELANILAGMGL